MKYSNGLLQALSLTAALLLPVVAQAQFVMPANADARSETELAARQATLQALTPVTDEQLENPPEHEWLHWRRTRNNWAWSPLDQINRSNVKNLSLAWSWGMDEGPIASPPLIHNGVMFLHHNGDRVQALDAENGDLLWEYTRRNPEALNFPKKSLAISGYSLFVPTHDAHLLALDIRSGAVLWDVEVAALDSGYTISGGPIVVKDKVIMGMSGCGAAQVSGCFITAHDVNTGAEVWRFGTIAMPGQPGGNSWNGLPGEARFGGSVWMPGSYDAALDLVYFGVGQPYPWNAEQRGTSPLRNEPGISNELLYTNSTLALNPDTGALVWHYQHLPNDSWDMDYVFERLIVNLRFRGEERKAIVTVGKLGIVEALDAATGDFLFARDLGVQNIVTAIDPETGVKTIDRTLDPAVGEKVTVCPHAGGGRNWPASAYNPASGRFYLPMQEHCGDYTPIPLDAGEVYEGGGGAEWTVLPSPNNDGDVGRVQSVNLQTQELDWVYRTRAPQTMGLLPTAGGLVFEGGQDRYFRALDESNGEVLWQTRLSNIPLSYPSTFSINGRQYVTIISSSGSALDATWSGLVPDLKRPANGGTTLWVFALPE